MRRDRAKLELARAIHGGEAYQQSVNTHCAMLVIEGKAEPAAREGGASRIGIGRSGDEGPHGPFENGSGPIFTL